MTYMSKLKEPISILKEAIGKFQSADSKVTETRAAIKKNDTIVANVDVDPDDATAVRTLAEAHAKKAIYPSRLARLIELRAASVHEMKTAAVALQKRGFEVATEEQERLADEIEALLKPYAPNYTVPGPSGPEVFNHARNLAYKCNTVIAIGQRATASKTWWQSGNGSDQERDNWGHAALGVATEILEIAEAYERNGSFLPKGVLKSK